MFSNSEIKHLSDLHASTGIYEKIIEAAYSDLLRRGDHAIDGGALGGMHTIPMAKVVGREGKIFAYEPLPQVCSWLRGMTSDYPQVDVVEAALSDSGGEVTFQNIKDEPWMSSIHKRDFIKGEAEEITVQRTTLDRHSGHPIRFIKLDLESGEYHALKGGLRLLRSQRPVVVCEWGGADSARVANYTANDYFGQLEAAGYDTADLFGQSFGRDDFDRPHGERPENIVLYPIEQKHIPLFFASKTRSLLL